MLAVCLSLLANSMAYGQDQADNDVLQESMRDFKTVAFAAAGGALLGISTLSFDSHPSRNFRTVFFVGGSIGVGIGVAVVFYQQAMKSRSTLPQAELDDAPSAYFNSRERLQWHLAHVPSWQGPLWFTHSFSF
jgi:hypothetical protein